MAAESQHAERLQKLKSRDAGFFNYFWQINQIGKTARDKKDVPPLDKLFPFVKIESQ